jgi:hypothetical protein
MSEASSADSVAMENTWKTQSSRRGGKRKLPVNAEQEEVESPSKRADTRVRSPRASLVSAAGSDGDTKAASRSGSEEDESEKAESDSGSSSEMEEDEDTRGGRKAFMSIPSFSFLNGTYRMYHDAYSTTLHTIEDASSAVTSTLHSMEATGSAILTDASTALSSAKKRLNDVVRSSFETVVGELAVPDEAVESEGSQAVSPEKKTAKSGKRGSKQAPVSPNAATARRRKSVKSVQVATPETPRRSTRSAASAVKSASKASSNGAGRKSK